MKNVTDISVCIPSFNGEKYIAKQLESIFSQELQVDEIIISDDSSTDRTVEIIKSYRDARIILLENNDFKSPALNLENALNHATGAVIFLSDQDDIWLPGKVKVMREQLKSYDLVVSDASLIDGNGDIIEESFFKMRNSGPGFLKNIKINTYIGCCMAFNRKTLQLALPFPDNMLGSIHDWWIGFVAETTGKVIFLDVPQILYRRHSNNVTATKSKTTLFTKMWWRYFMLKEIFVRWLQVKCRLSAP